ncbi:MAG: leucine-rich repeat domain-containing protein [Bacteroidales bacterium]|nr:leucine-rich repeat domain-containing protein [Bacteroidales bacterium]
MSQEEIKSYENQVRSMIRFVEETFNFLGNSDNPVKEKEIIFNESYSKIFLNNKVQIEDDLDENRDYPIYKDVQAYLKDIDFFFKSVEFEFEITEINHFINNSGGHYFKVTIIRTLRGITIRNDTVDTKKTRFVEVNLNLMSEDFKIASIYTTRFNEKEEIRTWWNKLPIAWRVLFGSNINIGDTLVLSDFIYLGDSTFVLDNKVKNEEIEEIAEHLAPDTITGNLIEVFENIKSILRKKELDISGNLQIRDLSPVAEMADLTSLNFSNTLVNNILPVRNLNSLETVNFSGIPVRDLSPLQYSANLRSLVFRQTLVTDITPVQFLTNLEKLDCSRNQLNDLSVLAVLPNLKHLDCDSIEIYSLKTLTGIGHLEHLSIAHTFISDLIQIINLNGLKYLNCDFTHITSVEPLKNLKELEILSINNTRVRFLTPLDDHSTVRKIYCNNSEVTGNEAIRYMRANPGCLVVYESEALKSGWENLDIEWKDIFRQTSNIGENPTEEELHALLKIEDLDISGRDDITNLMPLTKLYNLKRLNISGTGASDFSPLSELFKLKYLNVSNSNIENTEFFVLLSELSELHIDSTDIKDLEPIQNLPLKIIYAENTKITDKEAFAYVEEQPGCLVIYKSDQLMEWWSGLSDKWKTFLRSEKSVDNEPDREELHKIIFTSSLEIGDNSGIVDLKPLVMFLGLNNFSITNAEIRDLWPLSSLNKLTSISLSRCPVSDLYPLSGMSHLNHLSIKNAPLSDLKVITGLSNLQYLNFSGTGVSNLKPLQSLIELSHIEFSNTPVKSLKSLENLQNLQKIVCFNTRISSRTIDKFKAKMPDCEITYY